MTTGHIVATYRLSIKEYKRFKTQIDQAVEDTPPAIERRAIGVFAEASVFKEMFVRTSVELKQLQFINDDIRVPYKVMSNELTQEQTDIAKIRLLIEVSYQSLLIRYYIWFLR